MRDKYLFECDAIKYTGLSAPGLRKFTEGRGCILYVGDTRFYDKNILDRLIRECKNKPITSRSVTGRAITNKPTTRKPTTIKRAEVTRKACPLYKAFPGVNIKTKLGGYATVR